MVKILLPISKLINDNFREEIINATEEKIFIMQLIWYGFMTFSVIYYVGLWIPFLMAFSQELRLSNAAISIIPIPILHKIRTFNDFFTANLITS